MSEPAFYQINSHVLPTISAADIVTVRPPYIHFKRKYHEYILYYIISGEMYLTEDNTDYILKKNDFLILDPSHTHWGRQSSECRFFYVHFSMTLTREGMDECEQELFIPKYYHVEMQNHLLRCRQNAEQITAALQGHMPYAGLQAACQFYELLLAFVTDYTYTQHIKSIPVHGKIRQVLQDVISFLNQSYAMDISGEQLEAWFHYNFDYLNRQFKKWTGQTIFQYLNTIRIERARGLLLTGYYSMEEVAAQTGFRDVYYFSKVFKKYTGMTPGQCREKDILL